MQDQSIKPDPKFTTFHEMVEYFADDNRCRDYLIAKRWGGSPKCPYCACDRHYPKDARGRWKCAGCKRRYSVTTGSIFADTKIPLRIWMTAIALASFHSKGISSMQLAKDMGITQKSAWHVLHRLRMLMKEEKPELLTGTVEIDSTLIGGKEVNKHLVKRQKFVTGLKGPMAGKTEVFGMIQRGGRVYARAVVNSSSKTIRPIMRSMVEIGTTVYTDDHHGFRDLKEDYKHDYVKHGKKEYVKGDVHTQAIENFWSHWKRTVVGTQHFISPKHTNAYADQAAWIFNERKTGLQERLDKVLEGCNGRVLTFRELIAEKKDEAPHKAGPV